MKNVVILLLACLKRRVMMQERGNTVNDFPVSATKLPRPQKILGIRGFKIV